MKEPVFSKMTQPLFFSVVDSANPATTIFINAAHVIKIEIDAATRQSGIMHLVDGSQVQLNANDADLTMRLMAAGAHEQMIILGEFKKLTGGS